MMKTVTRLTLMGIFLFGELLLANPQDASHCQAALQSAVTNYRQLIRFGLESKAFSEDQLSKLTQDRLNPMGHGLTAEAKKLKAALDKTIAQIPLDQRRHAITSLTDLVRTSSQEKAVKQDARQETQMIFAPQIVQTLELPTDDSFRAFIHRPENGGNSLLGLWSEKGVILLDPLKTEKDIRVMKSRHDARPQTISTDRFLMASVGRGTQLILQDLKTEEEWTAPVQAGVGFDLKKGPDGTVYVITHDRPSNTTILAFDGKALTQIASINNFYHPELLFTSDGKPILAGILAPNGIGIYDVRQDKFTQRWEIDTYVAELKAHVTKNDEVVVAARTRADGNFSIRSFVRFFRQNDPKIQNYMEETAKNRARGSVGHFKWIEDKSGNPALIHENDDSFRIINPFGETQAPRPTQYLSRWWQGFSKSSQELTESNVLSQMPKSDLCEKLELQTDDSAAGFIKIICLSLEHFQVLSLDTSTLQFQKISEGKFEDNYGFKNYGHFFEPRVREHFAYFFSQQSGLTILRLTDGRAEMVFQKEIKDQFRATDLIEFQDGSLGIGIFHNEGKRYRLSTIRFMSDGRNIKGTTP